jgi:hypothetical protein
MNQHDQLEQLFKLLDWWHFTSSFISFCSSFGVTFLFKILGEALSDQSSTETAALIHVAS